MNEVLSPAGQAWMLKYGFLTITAPVPSIAKVTPGTTTAGRTLVVLGKNFKGTTSVTFQGVPAKFSVSSTLKLTVTVPSKRQDGQPDRDDAERHRDLEVGHDQGVSQSRVGALDTAPPERQPAGRAGSYPLPLAPRCA